MASRAFTPREPDLHVVVLDKDAGSWFIADSSLRGYDGSQVVREERSVGQKKLVRKAGPPSNRRIAWPRWTGFRGMTVRDWLDLLVVPLALVVISFLFTTQQDQRQQQTENQRAEAERELAEQRAQDEALQAYLNQMSSLLLEQDLRASEKRSEVRTLARARTLTMLGRLDPSRKADVMQFLIEADLVQRADGRDPIIGLSGADLSGADLSEATLREAVLFDADLSEADLSEADLSEADLRGANLRGTFLSDATLSEVHLRGANLRDAYLSGANLSGADLSEAFLRGAFLRDATLSDATLSEAHLRDAYLSGANLSYANLSGAFLRDANLFAANLSEANLGNANLSEANLRDADLFNANLFAANLSSAEGITNEQLDAQAESLEGATMPNGQKYEDWLKSKGKGEQ